ncbi:MAG: hypothetical protein Q9224_001822, partial [Gallowayella concinna]
MNPRWQTWSQNTANRSGWETASPSSPSAPARLDPSTSTAVAALEYRTPTTPQLTTSAGYPLPFSTQPQPRSTLAASAVLPSTWRRSQRPPPGASILPSTESLRDPGLYAILLCCHDPNNRLYGQPAPQIQQPIYGYPQYPTSINQNYPAAYAQHANQQQSQQQPPQQQHPAMTSQPQMMMPHQQQQPPQPPIQHQQAQSQPPDMANNSPRTKLEPQSIQQRPLDPTSLPQRAAPGPMSSNHNTPSGPQTNGHLHPGQAGRGGGAAGSGGANGQNPNAAPGPIPATTPTVVRQDGNGVQWIAFEYSRDRVKMEYTIRCDVESVNADQLSSDFTNENCVYPRACCSKEQYRGNRLNYETECNTVGWALAELNPCLRGKRGLIQRAVDSWRNSNQDPRLRSRRVRRQAKIQTRKQVQPPHPSHLAGPGGPGVAAGGPTGVTPSPNPMAAPVQRPQPSSMNLGTSQLHHHHAHPDGSAPGGSDEVSANGNYTPQQRQHPALPKQPSPNDVRQHHIFHGYPNYPTQVGQGSVALTPSLHDGIDGPLSAHPGAHPSNSSSAVATSVPTATKLEDNNNDDQSKASRPPSTASTNLVGDLPEAKRRKFIHVEDLDRGHQKIRVRATLDTVDLSEIPDSYRKSHSVFPRSYYPIQMQSPTRRPSRGNRFFQDDEEDFPGGGAEGEDEETVLGRTLVPVPMLEDGEGELAVPKIGRAKRKREEAVNDLGYRMSWAHGRQFAGRTMFLQRA